MCILSQGLPKSEAFQIRQSCLKRFSLCFDSIFGFFIAALTTISKSVRMSEGNFCRLRSFTWLFRLIRNSYGLIGLVEGSRKWSGRSFIKDSRRRFVVFMLKFSRNPVFLNNNCSNIWVIKSEKQNLYKNRW